MKKILLLIVTCIGYGLLATILVGALNLFTIYVGEVWYPLSLILIPISFLSPIIKYFDKIDEKNTPHTLFERLGSVMMAAKYTLNEKHLVLTILGNEINRIKVVEVSEGQFCISYGTDLEHTFVYNDDAIFNITDTGLVVSTAIETNSNISVIVQDIHNKVYVSK